MKPAKYLALAPLTAILAATPLVAQRGGEPTERQPVQSDELARPDFVKAPIGAEGTVSNEDGQPLGVVRDHVIDRRSGKVLHVAVDAAGNEDGQARLVPYDRFTWNAEEQRLLLSMSAEELAAMPAYDPENLAPIAARRMGGRERNDPGIEEKRLGQDELVGHVREASVDMGPSSLASSGILGSHVMAASEQFASVRELVLEPKQGRIAFVLASGESDKDDPYVIPWLAMTWQTTDDGEEQGCFGLSLTKDALEEAPTLQRGDTALLEDPEALDEVYGFYKLSPLFASREKIGSHE